jgi:hypothetical protein
MGPVEPGARQQPHLPTVEARMHAVAVELDFMRHWLPSGAGSTSSVGCGRIHGGRAVCADPGRRVTVRAKPGSEKGLLRRRMSLFGGVRGEICAADNCVGAVNRNP